MNTGIGAVQRAEAAIAQPVARPAGLFVRIGNADLERLAAAALEDAQDVARLRHLAREQRLEERQDALAASISSASAAARCAADRRRAVARVDLAELRVS